MLSMFDSPSRARSRWSNENVVFCTDAVPVVFFPNATVMKHEVTNATPRRPATVVRGVIKVPDPDTSQPLVAG